MTEISKVELYHKEISKRYPELFIRMTFDETNFLFDDFSSVLTNYFYTNHQPFHSQKSYDISIYCRYCFEWNEEDIQNLLEKELYKRAELIRNCLIPFIENINCIFVYGTIASGKYITQFEIAERSFYNDKQTFILTNQSAYNGIRYYYERKLMQKCLSDNTLSEKSKKQLYKAYQTNFYKEPRFNDQDAEKYMWVIYFINVGDDIRIYDRMENSITHYNAEHNIWMNSTFAKFRDQYVYDNIFNNVSHLDNKKVKDIDKQRPSLRRAIGKYEKSLSDAYEEWEYYNCPYSIQAKQLGIPEDSTNDEVKMAFIEYIFKSDYFDKKSKYEPEVIYNDIDETIDENKKNK